MPKQRALARRSRREPVMSSSEEWVEEVLRFWFGELEPRQWFTRDDALDALIRTRFLPLYERIREFSAEAPRSARTALATVIVLDQFPRNMFRGTPQAFATDALALRVSERSIAAGLDRELDGVQRTFLYMPFQHAEDPEVQARSVSLFASTGQAMSLDYARQHKEIIDRFGRFPHRNAILGRASTPEELEFMKTHAGF
jgi:uncharacterized protein (DUF924 family)